MQKQSQELRTGWFMKEQGAEEDTGPWLPVKQVPSEVHLDLLANNKCVSSFKSLTNSVE
jgi:beta-mannosidase